MHCAHWAVECCTVASAWEGLEHRRMALRTLDAVEASQKHCGQARLTVRRARDSGGGCMHLVSERVLRIVCIRFPSHNIELYV